MLAGPRTPIVSATRAPYSTSSESASERPLIDSPPFDWIIERGIALRQRLSPSQKTSIENSSPRHRSCTIDSPGVVRDGLGQPGAWARDPVLAEERVGEILVAHRAADLRGGREHEGGLERGARRGDDLLVEVGERHDEPPVVLS